MVIRVIYCYYHVGFDFNLGLPIHLDVTRIFRYTMDLTTKYPSSAQYCLAYFHGLVYRLYYFLRPVPPQEGLLEIAISEVIQLGATIFIPMNEDSSSQPASTIRFHPRQADSDSYQNHHTCQAEGRHRQRHHGYPSKSNSSCPDVATSCLQ